MAGILEGPAMQDCKEPDIWTVTTTVGSMDDARRLGRALVERRLAACVQIDALGASIYRWQGKVHEDPEVRLTIKTVADRRTALRAFFADAHPYDVPQVVEWPCEASEAYASWVRSEVS